MPYEVPNITPGQEALIPQATNIVMWLLNDINILADNKKKYLWLNALLFSNWLTPITPAWGDFEDDPQVPNALNQIANNIIASLEKHNKGVRDVLGSIIWKDREAIDPIQVHQACEQARLSAPIHQSKYSFENKEFPIQYIPTSASWQISYQKGDGSVGVETYTSIWDAANITTGIASKAQKIKPKTIEKDFGKEIKETEFDNFLDAIGNTLQKEGTYIFDTKPYKIKLSGTNYETTLPDGTLITDTKVNAMKAILTITEPPIIKDFWDSITTASMLALLTQVRLSKAQKGSYKFRDKTLKITDGGEKIEYLIPEQRGWFGKSIPEKISTIKDSNLNTLARELEKVSQVKPYTKKTKTKKEKPSNSEKKEWGKDWKKPEEEPKEEKKVKASRIKRLLWSPEFIEQIKAPAVRGLMKAGYRMTVAGVTLGAASVVWWVWVSAMIVGAMTTTFWWSLTWSFWNWFNKKYIDKDNK